MNVVPARTTVVLSAPNRAAIMRMAAMRGEFALLATMHEQAPKQPTHRPAVFRLTKREGDVVLAYLRELVGGE